MVTRNIIGSIDKMIVKKGLVVVITFLFFGLTIAPNINANLEKTSLDGELVEITTEICGIQGVKPQTIQLTQEEADELEKLFDEIKDKLDAVESREGVVEIFNEAIEELGRYDLLDILQVEHVQRLITGRYQNLRMKTGCETVDSNPLIEGNFFCLLAGNTDETIFNSLLSSLSLALCFLFIGLEIFILVWMGTYYISNFFPISLGQTISLGIQGTQWMYPANGWLSTFGLCGEKKWEGDMIGDIRLGILDEYVGVTGFTGLKVKNVNSNDVLYMGYACRVKIRCLE